MLFLAIFMLYSLFSYIVFFYFEVEDLFVDLVYDYLPVYYYSVIYLFNYLSVLTYFFSLVFYADVFFGALYFVLLWVFLDEIFDPEEDVISNPDLPFDPKE